MIVAQRKKADCAIPPGKEEYAALRTIIKKQGSLNYELGDKPSS